MASNSLGKVFRFSSFGESHGPAIGVLIDGCPAGVPISSEEINKALARRSPGKSPYTSPRNEEDRAEILSGVFEGESTGMPMGILIRNKDTDSSKYENMARVIRPGHANLSYTSKYGIFDYRGGGRASARETAARVAAGAVAKAMLSQTGLNIFACLSLVGQSPDFSELKLHESSENLLNIKKYLEKSAIFAPSLEAEESFGREILKAKDQGNSVGGEVSFFIEKPPAHLGEPVYAKLDALLAFYLMSIPATKAFSLGRGFASAKVRGSDFNDSFKKDAQGIRLKTNNAGGVLGGISTGNLIYGKLGFKPTSSIEHSQESLDFKGEKAEFKLPPGSRHDPCVAVRAVPVVEAMCWLLMADLYLQNRLAKI